MTEAEFCIPGDHVELLENNEFFKVSRSDPKVIYCMECQSCGHNTLFELDKQRRYKEEYCDECGSENLELIPWWVFNRLMTENPELQDKYLSALQSSKKIGDIE